MRLGFVVNPIAGAGGRLGLRGSDELSLTMNELGHAAARAARAMAGFCGSDVVTSAGMMGADVLRSAGVAARVVHQGAVPSQGADTIEAVLAMVAAGADIIIFVGGDGTARDLLAAKVAVPVLGVPAGVKMHSGVFATSPAAAAAILRNVVTAGRITSVEAEVIDRDCRNALCLFGLLRVPAAEGRQPAKAIARSDDDRELQGAIAIAAAELAPAPLLVIGPGATMLALKVKLGGSGTLLGVDVFAHGALAGTDVNEEKLWELCAYEAPRLVLGVIGGQGFLLGRGNQQISARIVRRAKLPPIVLASATKLAALPGGRMLVDSGDEQLDAQMTGHIAVRTGPRRSMMMRVVAA